MKALDFVTANWDSIVTLGGLVVGLVWHRGKAVKLDDLWDTLLKIGQQSIPKLLEDTRITDDDYVRAKIAAAIWAGLDRLKVPRNKTVEKLVTEAVEHIHADLAAKLIDGLLGKFVKTGEKTLAKLEAAT